MANNVVFKFGTKAKYDALAAKDVNTLYFLTDVLELWKGSELYGKGADATNLAAGLMSAADKAKLDGLDSTASDYVLTAGDGSIAITDVENGKSVKVKVSETEGNNLQLKADGLYVHVEPVALLSSAQVGTVTEANKPYDGAEVGDKYVDFALNDEAGTHLYVPTTDMFDPYVGGDGVLIDGSKISVVVDQANANGLTVGPAGLSLGLASVDKAGAMSAVDKVALDTLVNDMSGVKESIQSLETALTWTEL